MVIQDAGRVVRRRRLWGFTIDCRLAPVGIYGFAQREKHVFKSL